MKHGTPLETVVSGRSRNYSRKRRMLENEKHSQSTECFTEFLSKSILESTNQRQVQR